MVSYRAEEGEPGDQVVDSPHDVRQETRPREVRRGHRDGKPESLYVLEFRGECPPEISGRMIERPYMPAVKVRKSPPPG